MMDINVSSSLILTEYRSSDLDALVELLADQEIYDRTLQIPYPYTAADAERWLGVVAEQEQGDQQRTSWAIRNGADQLLGGVGLRIDPVQRHRAELGYWLGKPFWNQGIMTAVVAAVCRYGFDNLGLAKITAGVFSVNEASARVLQKCGFEGEGYLRKHYLKNGQFIDCRAFGLVRS